MDFTTHKTEIEIGTWGSACTGLLFLISAFVEFFTGRTWMSELGCLVGIVTIAAIFARTYLSRHDADAHRAPEKIGAVL